MDSFPCLAVSDCYAAVFLSVSSLLVQCLVFIMTDLLILQYWGKLEIDGIFICSRNKEMQPKESMETKTRIKVVLMLNSQILYNKEESNCCILINCNWTPLCMFWLTTQSLHWPSFASHSEGHPLWGHSWNFLFFPVALSEAPGCRCSALVRSCFDRLPRGNR